MTTKTSTDSIPAKREGVNDECGCITSTALVIGRRVVNVVHGKTIGSTLVVQEYGQLTALSRSVQILQK